MQRKTLQRRRSLLLLICLIFSASSYSQSTDYSKRMDSVMTALHDRGQFNGVILVATDGKPMYRSAFGQNNEHQTFTPETQSGIASLSKGFTAMIIMMLAEKGKLIY